MKLNFDCIRDILFYLEGNLTLSDDLEFENLNLYNLVNILTYSKQDIAYSLIKLEEADIIDAHLVYADNRLCDCLISDITYEGHEFISQIKSDNVWNKTKTVLGKIGSSSISIISSVSAKLITDLITQLPII